MGALTTLEPLPSPVDALRFPWRTTGSSASVGDALSLLWVVALGPVVL